MTDRVPPQNLPMEQAVLGSMLMAPSAIEAGREILRPEDFYRDAHRWIFESIASLDDQREPVDILTVSDDLNNRDLLAQIGGRPYLSTLIDCVITPSNAAHYAQHVRDASTRRRLVFAANRIIQAAYADDERIEDVVAECEGALTEATADREQGGIRWMHSLVNSAFDQLEKWSEDKRLVTGITTGLYELDYLTRGLQPKSLYVVAARPGMGKSALGAKMAVEAAKQHKLAFIASLEMGDLQLVHRMISAEMRIDANAMRTGYLGDDGWRKVGDACVRLRDLPLCISDQSSMTLTQLRIHCRRLAREKLGLVVVDYLQLLDGEHSREGRTREIDVIASALKGIAKEHDIPVVALAQLSRQVDQRADKRPMMSDLRESGGIEANADVVIFPYNPAHYGPMDKREDCEPVELIVAKNRDGMTGVAKALWFRRFTQFANVAKGT